jgi:FkbM family methyltransferase
VFGKSVSLAISPDCSLICHPRAYKIFKRDQVDDPEQSLELREFISYCSSSMLLYDIGAHFGVFSLTAAHFGARAIAVDPSPEAVKMVGIETALNQCTDRVQILCAAVSDANGVIAMLSSGVFSDGYFKTANQRPRRELTPVQAVTIDHMASKFGTPTHIKIDVEGHEAAVLRGATVTLKKSSPILFLELHNEIIAAAGGNPCIAMDELQGLGYDIFTTDGYAIDRSAILTRPIIRVIAKRRAE